jgi:glyoxylase-like metal-dependent hydrolase (beta-lactamase superfamily II)
MQLVSLHGHTPGHTGYEFSSKGKKILFWGDIIHVQRVQLQDPEVTVVFDIDPASAAATRNQLLPELTREDVVIAGPHMLFPSLGRLHKTGSGYSWAPVAFTNPWVEKQVALPRGRQSTAVTTQR